MPPALEEQIEGLKRAIDEMEAQRGSLGNEAVDAALVPFQRKLDELDAMLDARDESLREEQVQQRKLVTLLFMDIVGSTQLTQHMDPEDVMEIIDGALRRLAEPVELYGGRVTRFMGDGFLSVFGAPTAREDDPERAVRAGLAIIELSGEIADEYQAVWNIQDFQVRVGVSTGLVVLGGETEAEDTLMGSVVNLAARLESAAPPGGLLISHDTYRHIRGVFDVDVWEPIQVKGFDELAQVYRILRAKPRTFRLHTRGVEGVETRMIGRETELKYLQDALLTAIEEGEGHVVTIVGEAGVGKSRLLYEFQNWIELLPPPAVYLFEGRGRQEAQGLPYRLLRDMFEFRFKVQDDEPLDSARKKFTNGLMKVFEGAEEDELRAHILGQLLGYDFSASLALQGVLGDPEQLRNRGLMYLGEYFRELSHQAPVVVFLEDIHWADDSSLDALNWLGERLHQKSLLVVCAARPTLFERRPYWGEGQSYHTHLDLRPLSKRESRQLIAEIFKFANHLPGELRELVVEGAEGNPFYVEELVKMLVEQGVILKGEDVWQIEVGRLTEIEVPPTLAGVLQARLDSLPLVERTVLQQASVVGRQFWDRVVVYIQAAGDDAPQFVPEALTALRGRELIYRREGSTFSDAHEYLFKNAILREVTYESVLKRMRRRYHGLVADWLIAHSAGRAGESNGLIAEHLLQAGRKEACQYFQQAGEAALESYANAEAEGYFRRALALSPSGVQGAVILAGLGQALQLRGSREEAVPIFKEAIELFLELGEHDRAADLYARLSRVLWHDDHKKAWDVCQEGLRRLEKFADGPGMARMLAEAARTAHFRLQPKEEVVALCNRAIAMAERQSDLEAKVEASITLTFVMENIMDRIELLEEVDALCEANGLWRQVSRARNALGYEHFRCLLNSEIGGQYYLQAVDVNLKTGDIEGLLHSLGQVAHISIRQGHLNSLADRQVEILHRSSAPPSSIEKFLDKQRPYILSARGEWRQALEYCRQSRVKLRQGANLEIIANTNISLADACLELNRFAGLADLSEAEAVLQENIEMGWDSFVMPRPRMVVLLSRQGRFKEAYEELAVVIETMEKDGTRFEYALRVSMESELARAEGNWGEVISACQGLIDIYQTGGYRWDWARWMIDLGDALLGRGGPGDREKAKEVFRQSLEMFSEMGAAGYIQVLKERLRRM